MTLLRCLLLLVKSLLALKRLRDLLVILISKSTTFVDINFEIRVRSHPKV